MSTVPWSPDEQVRQRAQLTRFLAANGFSDFEELYRFSVENIPSFTERVLDFLGLRFHRPYSQVLDVSAGDPWARWCVGGGLNIARILPAPRSGASCGDLGGRRRRIPNTVLRRTHRAGRAAAQACGNSASGKGDAIAIHLPMVPETVVASLPPLRSAPSPCRSSPDTVPPRSNRESGMSRQSCHHLRRISASRQAGSREVCR